VWVDGTASLHLKITQNEGKWQCAEVVSKDSFGFGTYRFHVSTPLSQLDQNITLGLFTWSDSPVYAHREIDVECGKWGRATDTNNAQFVVQPYAPPGRLIRYPVPENMEGVVYSFLWQSNSVSFKCAEDNAATHPSSSPGVIREWDFSEGHIPQAGRENARMNLWLSVGRTPQDTNHTEIVISKFEFIPVEASLSSN
jgi:hypothetical protein